MLDLKKLWLIFFMSTTMTATEVKMDGHPKHGTEFADYSIRSSRISSLQKFRFKIKRRI
jgi:hypothetical protein